MYNPFTKKVAEDDEEQDEALILAAKKAAKRKKSSAGFHFFPVDIPGDKILVKPQLDYRRHKRLIKRVQIQAILIVILFIAVLISYPIFRPTNIYFARQIGASLGREKRLPELDMPVINTESILSWAQTNVTEILTFNFANFNQKLSSATGQFTPEGWTKFLEALIKAKTIEQFQKQQLVATAAPSDRAIVEYEGFNEATGEYEWQITVPMIRKFISNNDVSRITRTRVALTIVRMPTIDYPSGMAISVWSER
jgi:hypothetical protein